uniref:SKA complex subunit 1 homolog n=1 Tax=Lactuca sativa TaxID=4236 RepID=A0A9R1VXW7_LACSA|nr:hypothetical protein LSAT_V11C400174580 [Lactuca sativa]
MDVKQAGLSLDSLVSSFNTRIAELQDLVVARNSKSTSTTKGSPMGVTLSRCFYSVWLVYPASSITDLTAVDTTLKAMEHQLQQIKDRLREETLAIPKAKKLIKASLQQQQKLQSMSVYAPSYMPERGKVMHHDNTTCSTVEEPIKQDYSFGIQEPKEEPAPLIKEKKGRGSPPLWYITANELDSLSSYMRGRLTLDKINAAINDMAVYAEANSQLITAPRKKLTESTIEKALEVREIGMAEGVKGKHFFLETDVKGPSLKLDITGKAILTVSFRYLFIFSLVNNTIRF